MKNILRARLVELLKENPGNGEISRMCSDNCETKFEEVLQMLKDQIRDYPNSEYLASIFGQEAIEIAQLL